TTIESLWNLRFAVTTDAVFEDDEVLISCLTIRPCGLHAVGFSGYARLRVDVRIYRLPIGVPLFNQSYPRQLFECSKAIVGFVVFDLRIANLLQGLHCSILSSKPNFIIAKRERQNEPNHKTGQPR